MPVIIDGTLGVNAAAVTTTSWNPTNLVIPGNSTIGDATSDTLTVNAGALNFAQTAQKITGDMSTSTVNNRFAIQSNVTNGQTVVNILPNGTGTVSSIRVFNNSDASNGYYAGIQATSTEAMIAAGSQGGTSYIPMTFYTGNAERMRIDSVGNIFTGGVGGSVGQADANSTAGQQVVLGAKRELRWNNTNAAIYGGAGGSDDMLYFYSGNSHVFRTASAERLRIDINGNVGIGTNAPTTPLEINWSAVAAITLTYQNSTSRRAFLGGNPGYSANYNALIIGSNATAVGTQSNTALPSWYTAYGAYTLDGDGWKVLYQPAGGSVVERLRIDGSGYAMINTQTASGQFTVYRKGGDNVVAITGDNSNSAGTGTCFSAISKSDNAGGGRTGTGLYVSSPYDGTNATGTTYSLYKYGVFVDDLYSYYGVNSTNSYTNYGVYVKGGGYNYLAANTGIGTSQPGAKLEVANGSTRTSILTHSSRTSTDQNLNWFLLGKWHGAGTSSRISIKIVGAAGGYGPTEAGTTYIEATLDNTAVNVTGFYYTLGNGNHAGTPSIRTKNNAGVIEFYIQTAHYGSTSPVVMLTSGYWTPVDTDTGSAAAPANTIALSNQISYNIGGNIPQTINVNGIGLGGAAPTSGMGIRFPPTQQASSDANTLDDYEEGTWSPVAYTTYGATVTTSNNSWGFYVKIGRKVTCWFVINMTISNSGGNVGFYGLPFSAIDGTLGSITAGSARQDNVGGTMFNMESINGTAVGVMRRYDNAGVDNGNPIMRGWFTYFTAS